MICLRIWLTKGHHNNLWGEMIVLTTVLIGTCVSIQGNFVRRLASGLVTVQVGEKLFTGRPVAALAIA